MWIVGWLSVGFSWSPMGVSWGQLKVCWGLCWVVLGHLGLEMAASQRHLGAGVQTALGIVLLHRFTNHLRLRRSVGTRYKKQRVGPYAVVAGFLPDNACFLAHSSIRLQTAAEAADSP